LKIFGMCNKEKQGLAVWY